MNNTRFLLSFCFLLLVLGMLVLSGCQKPEIQQEPVAIKISTDNTPVTEITDTVDSSEVKTAEEAEAEVILEAELEDILAASNEDLEAELIE